MAPAPFPSPTKTWHDTSYPSISPTLPALSASGKSVLITGGGTGIGAGTAHSFAQAGASRIAILGRREANLRSTAASIKAKHPSVEVLTLPTDVTDASAVNAAFAAFLPAGKTLDILVHSAAVVGPHAPVATVEPAEFLDTVTNIVSGALYVAQAFARHAAPGAVAIEINSSAAHINFGPGLTAYSTAKLAAFRLWDSLGYAGKENGWRVYHVQPGVVDSEMNRSAGGVKAMGFEDHVSLPSDFNVWLASQEAAFLSGKFLWANWDVDELKASADEIQKSTKFDIQLVGWPFDHDSKWKFGGPVDGDGKIWG